MIQPLINLLIKPMSMKVQLVTFFSIVFSLSSFAQNQGSDIIAKRIKSVDSYNSNEFVLDVTDIAVFGEYIVMLDEKLGKVIVADKNFSSLETFGDKGGGPLELQKPNMLIHDQAQGMLYAYDAAKFKLWPIDLDVKEVKAGMPFEFMLIYQTVAIENSIIYFTSVSNLSIDVLRYSLKDKKQLEGLSLDENSVKSFLGRYILSDNDRFVVISSYDGLVIDTYDEDWTRINNKDLGGLPIIAKFLNKNQPSGLSVSGGGSAQKVASGRSTIRSARLYKNELCLLAIKDGKDAKSRANVILKYRYENNEWQPSGKILLPEGGDYQTFTVLAETDQLVAFDRENGTIDLFEIKY